MLELEEENYYTCYIEYKDIFYKFGIPKNEEGNFTTSAEYGIKKLGTKIVSTSTTNIELGSQIHWDDEDWTIMYTKENEIQMICNNILKYKENYFNFGYNDVYLMEKNGWEKVTVDYNDSGEAIYSLSENERMQRAIDSYNSAIETLNDACFEIVDNTKSYVKDVRCVGSDPENMDNGSTNFYESDFLYKNFNSYNGKLKDEDYNFVKDYERLFLLDKLAADGGAAYWWASRDQEYYFEEGYEEEESFNIYRTYNYGSLSSNSVVTARVYFEENDQKDLRLYGDSCTWGLRPVVIIDTTKCTFNYDSQNNYFTILEKN